MRIFHIFLLLCLVSTHSIALELKSYSVKDLEMLCKEWQSFKFVNEFEDEKKSALIHDWKITVGPLCKYASGASPDTQFWVAYEPKGNKVEAVLEGEFDAGRKEKNSSQYTQKPIFNIQYLATAPSNLSIPQNKERKVFRKIKRENQGKGRL